jgi:hypothetical protein
MALCEPYAHLEIQKKKKEIFRMSIVFRSESNRLHLVRLVSRSWGRIAVAALLVLAVVECIRLVVKRMFAVVDLS